MTPLCALLSSYGSDWSPAPVAAEPKIDSPKPKKISVEKIDSKTEIFVEAVNLLWNLCEASPLALKMVNEKQILPFLLNHLVSNFVQNLNIFQFQNFTEYFFVN